MNDHHLRFRSPNPDHSPRPESPSPYPDILSPYLTSRAEGHSSSLPPHLSPLLTSSSLHSQRYFGREGAEASRYAAGPSSTGSSVRKSRLSRSEDHSSRHDAESAVGGRRRSLLYASPASTRAPSEGGGPDVDRRATYYRRKPVPALPEDIVHEEPPDLDDVHLHEERFPDASGAHGSEEEAFRGSNVGRTWVRPPERQDSHASMASDNTATSWWTLLNPFSRAISMRSSRPPRSETLSRESSGAPLTGDGHTMMRDRSARQSGKWTRWEALRPVHRARTQTTVSMSPSASRAHGLEDIDERAEGIHPCDMVHSPESIHLPVQIERSRSRSFLPHLPIRRNATRRAAAPQRVETTAVDTAAKEEEALFGALGRYGLKITRKYPDVKKKSTAWTTERWILLLSVTSMFVYGLLGLLWACQLALRLSTGSDVSVVSDPDILLFLLLSSILSLLSALIGLTGLMLISRPILAFYALFLWPTLLALCFVGYTAYKRGHLNLERKLNQSWSQWLSDADRARIQLALECCGYYNPLHDATYSLKCYPRSPLPGCKSKWTLFERAALSTFSRWAFGIIPVHLLNIVISILCANHVDRRFGTGLTPEPYRLKQGDVRDQALALLDSVPAASVGQPLPVYPGRRDSGPIDQDMRVYMDRAGSRGSSHTLPPYASSASLPRGMSR